MPQHPSRAIVVRVTASREWALDARVFAQCWTPFGERRHICAEEMEITSAEAALGRCAVGGAASARGRSAGGALVPRPAPDGPAGVCRDRVAGDRVVLDGATLRTAAGDPRAGGSAVGDLAWTRLTRWRELIARIFENRGMASLPTGSEVKVTYGPPPSALYMAAWLMDGLRRAGANPRLEIDTGPAGAPGGTDRAGSACRGEPVRATAVRRSGSTRQSSQATLPEPSEYALMREELAIAGHDPVFERCFPPLPDLRYRHRLMSVRWHTYPDAKSAAQACAHHITGILEEVLSGPDTPHWRVSGGSTPQADV